MSLQTSRLFNPILFTLALLLVSPGCQSDDQVIGRGKLGKTDLIGTCQGDGQDFCGGMSEGTCYCDDSCDDIGDCCDDKANVCDGGTAACETPHTACDAGDPGCWSFGAAEGLTFSGDFVAECDENTTCLIGTCQFNPACGLDAPCPGLCAQDTCTTNSQAGSCEAPHTACDAGDPGCWSFGAAEGLTFSGDFIAECDENTTTCLIGTCQFNPACGLDAPCPGLCAQDTCTI